MTKYILVLLSYISVAMLQYTGVSLAAEVPNSVLSINNATIGITTLDEIQKIYGMATPYRVSKEDEADIQVCYYSKDKLFLIFESGVMGNFKEITGFRISTLQPRTNCVFTNIDIKALSTGNGVHLGQSLKDFENTFPFKFVRRRSDLFYETVRQRKATKTELKSLRAAWPDEKQDYFDVTITIKAKFKKKQLIDFYAHKIESY